MARKKELTSEPTGREPAVGGHQIVGKKLTASAEEGAALGELLGAEEGLALGDAEGEELGDADGASVGTDVGACGTKLEAFSEGSG